MKILDFIEDYKAKKVMNTQLKPNAVSDYLKETLEIKEYIPFKRKREIAEMIVEESTQIVDGVKKNDAIGQYVSFVVAMIASHTKLEFSNNPVDDYDVLAESGLLTLIVNEFKADYSECDILLKMALAAELESNNIENIIGRFLDKVANKIDEFSDALKDKFENFGLKDIFGEDFKEENLTELIGLLDKLK